jgi:hypothetical protein
LRQVFIYLSTKGLLFKLKRIKEVHSLTIKKLV